MSQEQETTAHHCHSISSSELCVRMCEWAFIAVCFHYYVCVCVCVCGPTSPGIVIVGHSVCGLDGGEVRLQGKQLTGQVWHTAGRKMEW